VLNRKVIAILHATSHIHHSCAQYEKTPLMELKNHRIIIASDVQRDGIGIEIYENDKLIIEIFRSDSERERTIRTFKQNIPINFMEEYIAIFKKEIPWEFIDD
jgi:hypothetical protein